MNTKIKDTEYDWRSPEVFHTLSQNLLNPLWCSFVLLQRFCIPLQFFFLSGTDAWPLFTKNKELCIYNSSDSCFFPNSTFLSLWGFLCVFFSYLLIPIQGHEVLHFTQFISTPAPQRKGPELWNIFSFSQCIAIFMSAYAHTYVKEWVSLCILSFEAPKVKKEKEKKVILWPGLTPSGPGTSLTRPLSPTGTPQAGTARGGRFPGTFTVTRSRSISFPGAFSI